MRSRHATLIPLLLVLLTGVDLGPAEGQSSQVVVATDLGPTPPPGRRVEYDLARIPIAVSWHPDEDAFPLRLGRTTRKAQILIRDTEHIVANPLFRPCDPFLASILIQSLQTGEGDWEGQWYVQMDFWSESPRSYGVRTLLDGTYCTVRTMETTKVPPATSPNENNFSRSNETASDVKRSLAIPTEALIIGANRDPWDEIRSPEFRIPQVQWDPLTGEFPVDLGSASRLAKKWLVEHAPGIGGDLILWDVDIHWFLPSEAVEAQQLDLQAHFHHYFMEFDLTDRELKARYEVYMLLDRRIMCALKRLPVKTTASPD